MPGPVHEEQDHGDSQCGGLDQAEPGAEAQSQKRAQDAERGIQGGHLDPDIDKQEGGGYSKYYQKWYE